MKQKENIIPLLKLITKTKGDDIAHIIDHLNDSAIDNVCECVYNVIFTDLNLTKQKKSALRKHIKKHCQTDGLKKISSKTHPVFKRRQLLKQEGAGLPFLLMSAIPFLVDLFKNAISPK
jgi:Glu-tRNA(Gln) amidotransferase subunit E-like FAD-binding protein